MRKFTLKTTAGKADFTKRIVWGLEIIFCLGCMIYSFCIAAWSQALGCAATMLLVSLPMLFEKLTKRRMDPVFFICCSLYALGPMMGDVFLLYYITPWWDKLLHFIGGVVFAILAVFLLNLLNRKNTAITCAVFALCFSMAISVVWEFCEFGMDSIAGTDAQHDTIVSSIHSYLLGDKPDEITRIDHIQKTVINDTEIEGYIDIGLHDTMTDMLYESLGALVFSSIFLFRNSGKRKARADAGG